MASAVIEFASNTLTSLFHVLTLSAFRPLAPPPSGTNNTDDGNTRIKNTMVNIVIVGGSFSAMGTAHRILQKAAKTPGIADVKVTLVSRDSHFYWNLAATRATVQGKIPDEKIFQSIPEGFAKYGSDKFQFLLGSATGVDVQGKNLTVAATTTEGGTEEISVAYNVLILATGTHTKVDSPYKSRGTTEKTKEALHQLQARVKDAKTIVVAGAGPTGVELAGEIADGYGSSKKVILLTGSATVLNGYTSRMITNATKYLGILGVEIRASSIVETTNELPDGKTEVVFATGQKLTTDVYIPTYGVVPNSSYLSADMLDERGFINVDDCLVVKGAKDVYAIGEVSNCEPMNFLSLEAQSKHMANNAVLIASGKPTLPYKKNTVKMIGVCVSKNYATGHFNSIPLPSFLLIRLRKVYFMDWLPGRVDGSGY
ncbi:hypothetical protein E4U17_007966 [Claviceps sp. LM77 group G4]|nr:hypothetical protein E4U17_007966 [Claviceps sp. LM77 group G4]KAG6067368.1 hypothetical protein E4U33_005331 [Claviceps sp. LM78 group G4]KAG6078587.1 hypothetical protein E4U16_001555 [Claviceps sp. LM84 group G4]